MRNESSKRTESNHLRGRCNTRLGQHTYRLKNADPLPHRRIDQAGAIKLLAVNLFKILTLLALLQCVPIRQVACARVKGLIYNRDGKFIYRPPRSNHAHIIVIDDRSPRDSQNQHNQNGRGGSEVAAKSASDQPPTQIQLIAAAPAQVYPQAASGQIHLVGLADLQQQGLGAGATAGATSGQFMPQIIAADPRTSSSARNPAGGHSSAATPPRTIQVVPLIQLFPRLQQSQHHMSPRISPPQSSSLPIGLGMLTGQPAIGLGHEFGVDQLASDQQQAQHQHQHQQQHHSTVSRAKFAANFEPQDSLPSSAYDQPYSMGGFDQQVPSDPFSMIDEPLNTARLNPGGHFDRAAPRHRNDRPSHRQPPPVHDLDRLEDMEGDQVEYYEERSRLRSSQPAGPLTEGLMYRQHGPAALMPSLDRPPYVPVHVPVHPSQSQDLLARPVGPPPGQENFQAGDGPKPALPVKNLRRAMAGKTKVAGSGGPGKKPAPGEPQAASFDEPLSEQPPAGAAGKDPKSSHYWRQFKDLYDII